MSDDLAPRLKKTMSKFEEVMKGYCRLAESYKSSAAALHSLAHMLRCNRYKYYEGDSLIIECDMTVDANILGRKEYPAVGAIAHLLGRRVAVKKMYLAADCKGLFNLVEIEYVRKHG